MTSWKPQVQVAGEWSSNSLVFATEAEAKLSADQLMMRWFSVQDSRAVESSEAVNAEMIDGRQRLILDSPAVEAEIEKLRDEQLKPIPLKEFLKMDDKEIGGKTRTHALT